MLSAKSQPIRKSLIDYLHFENVKSGITDSNRVEDVKIQAMNSLLDNHGLNWSDVENFLDYRLISRDNNGWITNSHTLNISNNDGKFYRFDGFTINKTDQSIHLLVQNEPFYVNFGISRDKKALFTWQDISAVLYDLHNMTQSYFSLDPIDEKLHLHPFQGFDYSPKCLKGTMFLHTLFHTDYLLKQFAMGVEVSSQAPFEQRKAAEDGLFKGMSKQLIDMLKPIHERGKTHHKCRRLWIQADMLEHEIVETDSEVKFLFGKINMSIRTHPMIHDSDGNLIDTSDQSDENSPETLFSKDLTENYDNISVHFREFARLKELCKLQYLAIFLRGYRASLIKMEENNLSEYRVNQIYADAKERVESNLINMLDNIKSQVTNRYDDEEARAVTDALSSKFNSRNLLYLVKNWLRSSRSSERNALIDELLIGNLPTKDTIRQQIRKQVEVRRQNFDANINSINASETFVRKVSSWPKAKEWVPALFTQTDESSYVYGGVLLNPKLIDAKLSHRLGGSSIKLEGKSFVASQKMNNYNKPSVNYQAPIEPKNIPVSDILRDGLRYANTLKAMFNYSDSNSMDILQSQLLSVVTHLNKLKKAYANNDTEYINSQFSHENIKSARATYESRRSTMIKEWEK